MTAALSPSAVTADLALRQRLEARIEQPRAKSIQLQKPFDASVRQADAIGACQVVNRYCCHGPVVNGAMAVGKFFGGASVPALVAVFVLAWAVMEVVA